MSEVPVGEPFQGPDTRAQIVIPVDKAGNVITGGGGGGSGSGGGAASYLSPGDLAAAFSTVSQLSLSLLPFPPLFEQFVQVAEYDGDNLIDRFTIDDPQYEWAWTPGADASTGVLEIVKPAAIITLVNAAVVAYEAHRQNITGGIHGAADATNVITPALYPATTEAEAIALGSNLRTMYEAHRVLVAGGEHGIADATNTIASPNPTTWDSLVTFLNEFRNTTGFNQHIELTVGPVHGATGAADALTAPTVGSFTTGNTFVVQIAGPERDTLDVTTDFGGPYTHRSPRDFDVVFATATTLTVGGVTPIAMSPDEADISAVVEIAAGGRIRATYTRLEWAITWAAGGAGTGVLTIAGATMQNGSAFIVFVEGPEHGIQAASAGGGASQTVKRTQHQDTAGKVQPSGADAGVPVFTSALLSGPAAMPIPAGGAGMWSTGQGDFTAIFASIETLTLGAFPTALGTPISGNFFAVVESLAAGGQIVHVPTDFPMTLAAQILTVSGAGFINTSTFDVWCWGPPRGYDASLNGIQGKELSPLNQFTQNPVLVNVTNETDSTIPYYIDLAGYKYGILSLALSCVAGTVTATLWGSNDESVAAAAVTDYLDITLEMFGVSSLVASAGSARDDWMIDTPCAYKHLRLQIEYATGGNTGDALARYRGIY